MEYSVLSRIDSTRHNWRIKVRVYRMWHLSGTSKGISFYAVELILVDEEGTGITASIGENEVAKFSLSIVEGHAYFFRNFRVSKERRKYYAVPSTYTIFFTPWTIIEEVPAERACALPLYVFNFVDFDDLDDRARHPQGLVDIIGKLIVVHPLMQSSTLNGPSVRRNVELQDLSGQSLVITLWAEHATSFEDEFLLEAIGKYEPVVVVFAGLNTKLFLGNASYRSSVGIKWYINIDIPEVNAFHASLRGKGSEVLLLPSDGDAATENIDEANANRRSISELLSLNPHDNNVGLIGPTLHKFDMM
ncbi:hypothetical protein ABZP36_015051 [Zizania latifolia]